MFFQARCNKNIEQYIFQITVSLVYMKAKSTGVRSGGGCGGVCVYSKTGLPYNMPL